MGLECTQLQGIEREPCCQHGGDQYQDDCSDHDHVRVTRQGLEPGNDDADEHDA